MTQLEAKKSGYSDVVYLDAKTDTCVHVAHMGPKGQGASTMRRCWGRGPL